MAEYTQDELKAKILEFLGTKDMAKNREVADALGAKKRDVDMAISELANAGEIEYLYLGGSFVTLPKK